MRAKRPEVHYLLSRYPVSDQSLRFLTKARTRIAG